MKVPGPDHPITIKPHAMRVTVTYNGAKIAESERALLLEEADYPAVAYIPREDVDMAQLEAHDHSTYCPYKGDASYFSVEVDGKRAETAVWYYADPYPAVAEIKDHVAFYPDKMDAIDHAST